MLVPASAGISWGADQIVWEMDYTRLHFDWNGYWDKTAWWAYTLWFMDLPDWCYLWSWYGLGWSYLSPLDTPPTAKMEIYITPDDGMHFTYPDGAVRVGILSLPDLVLGGDTWFYQALEFGWKLTQYETAGIAVQYGVYQPANDQGFTLDAVSSYVGQFIYPWHHYSGGAWYPKNTAAQVAADYIQGVINDDYRKLSW